MAIWLFVSFRIDMYTEGVADLYELVLLLPLCPPEQKDAKVDFIKEKIRTRYFPAFEKVRGAVQHFRISSLKDDRKTVPGHLGILTFISSGFLNT